MLDECRKWVWQLISLRERAVHVLSAQYLIYVLYTCSDVVIYYLSRPLYLRKIIRTCRDLVIETKSHPASIKILLSCAILYIRTCSDLVIENKSTKPCMCCVQTTSNNIDEPQTSCGCKFTAWSSGCYIAKCILYVCCLIHKMSST